jgi:MFS family permease
LPMCTLVGVAIASIFIGTLSDRYGRKSLLLILGWVSAVGSVVKYFTSDTFWGFCASNFAFGFFLGNLPVGRSDILYLCGITSFRTCSQLTFTFVLNC